MNKKLAQYRGYTLAEVLIVLMVMIILGGLGAYSFGGMRDTVLVKQNIEEIKQDLQLAQQKAMLLERRQGEGWIYGIGIDFRNISNGTYKFFKWCSPFAEYGNIRTRTEIIAYNPEIEIGAQDSLDMTYSNGNNAILPVSEDDYESGGFCNSEYRRKYTTNLSGVEDGEINAGFNMGLSSNISFVVFEAVTGRAFLYDENGWPANYDEDGNLRRNSDTDLFDTLGIIIFRNRGNLADTLTISPLSGNVNHTIWDDPTILGILSNIVAGQNNEILDTPSDIDPSPNPVPAPDPVPDPVPDPIPDPEPDPIVDPITIDPFCCVSDPKLGIECITVQCDQIY